MTYLMRKSGFRSDANKDTFASLRVPAFRMLWWSGVCSFMGIQMQFLLRGLLAWDLTEREGALGAVYLMFGLALLIFTPIGGVAADRFNKKSLIAGAQAFLALSALFMGIAVISGNGKFWMLLVSSAVQGAMFGLFGPARISFAAELVGREQLGNAISLTSLSMSTTRIFAPSLAGVLAGVALFGIGGAYLIAAFFSLGSVALAMRLPSSPPVSKQKRNPIKEIIDGVRYVRERPHLKRLVLTSVISIMFGFNYTAFMPALVEGIFGLGDSEVGFMSTASAIGAVVISAIVASRAQGLVARQIMVVCGIGFGIGVIIFGISPSYWVALIVVAVLGACTTGFQTLSSSISMSETDSVHQGRVQSMMQLSWAGFGIAAAPLGALAEVIGLRVTIVLMGIVTLLAVTTYWFTSREEMMGYNSTSS